jgi:hypothetical protein
MRSSAGYRVGVCVWTKSGFLTRIILAGEAGLLAVEARPSDAYFPLFQEHTFAKLILMQYPFAECGR